MQYELDWMRIGDYDSVAALWLLCDGLGDVESREEMDAFLQRNPGMSVVARAGDRILGAALCGHDGRRGYLYHLAVHSDARCYGVAKAIVERCLQRLSEERIKRCSIHLYRENVDGEEFWYRIGWRDRVDLKVLAVDLPHEL